MVGCFFGWAVAGLVVPFSLDLTLVGLGLAIQGKLLRAQRCLGTWPGPVHCSSAESGGLILKSCLEMSLHLTPCSKTWIQRSNTCEKQAREVSVFSRICACTPNSMRPRRCCVCSRCLGVCMRAPWRMPFSSTSRRPSVWLHLFVMQRTRKTIRFRIHGLKVQPAVPRSCF